VCAGSICAAGHTTGGPATDSGGWQSEQRQKQRLGEHRRCVLQKESHILFGRLIST